MAIRVALHHRTEYRFDREVRLAAHSVRLRPAPHCRTRVTGYSLKVEPAAHFLNWQQDPQGNHVARLVFPEPARRWMLFSPTSVGPIWPGPLPGRSTCSWP